jgi:hypothetical protein
MGRRTVSSMHQQVPSAPSLPHSNAVPQRAQASWRSGKVRAGIMVALSGGIVGLINHAAVTSLRRMEQARNAAFVAFSSMARGPWKLSHAMPMIKLCLTLNWKDHVDDRPLLLDHAEWSQSHDVS